MTGTRGTADGAGATARFDNPVALAIDSAGNLFIADSQNEMVRKMSPAGVVTTLVGAPKQFGVHLGALPASLSTVFGVAVAANGDLVIASEHSILDVRNP